MNEHDHARPTRHPSIETALFGSEAVLYDERSGTVHHLNPSACAVWLLLDGRSIGDVVAGLAERTGLPRTEIGPDVLRAIADLDEAGLLEGEPASGS